MSLPRLNPATLLLMLIARMQAAPKPVRESLWRCRFCREQVGPEEAAIAMHLAHPPNNCSRYGKRGSLAVCAVPVKAVEPRGRNYEIKQHPRGG